MERNFQQASRKIEILSESLEEFRQALFDENECGKSIKALYLESNADQPFVNLRQDYSSITYKDVDEFTKKLTRYFTYFNKFENSNHFWSNELDFSKFESSDFIRIKDSIHDAIKTFDEFLDDSRELLHKELDYETVTFYLLKSDEINQLISNLDNDETYLIFQRMLEKTPDEDGQWLVDMEKTVMKCFNGDGMESSLKSSELGRFQEALEHAIKARRNIFSWLSWKLFSKDQIFVTRVLVANELKSNKEGFQTLLNKIDNRLNYEHNLSIILKKDWLCHFPESMRKIEIQNWFFYSRIAFKSYKLVHELRNIDSYVNFKVEDRNQQINLLTQFLALLEKIPVHKMQWSNYISDSQLRLLLTGKVELDQILKELESDFDSLRDYHQLKNSFSISENNILELISEKETNTEEAVKIFHNSLALSWIDHIEAKYPVLRSVSTLEFEQNLKELRESVDIKRKTSSDILLLKLREKTYEDVEYNRLQNRVTYRDLQHQVTKKKRIWPLRKVIQEFDEELFRLIPCWMASPESASAIFPMKQFFDLVIFDEASQCFAERGIPAMFRGKQIVVAGDEKQLRPFDLYRVRWEEENTEDIPELEVDSLLELTKKYLPSVRLNGHYRSKSLELIEFSNRHFYDGKLRMLPLRENMNKDIPAISYVKADGVWEDGKNEKEAEIVISLIEKINKNHPDKSIGIVTFNSKQQNLILDFIDQKIQEWGVLPDNLFVKNIENVQGDERDIIIFSTAYAPDEKGKLRLQFGSLNVQGGENRLNVAVTRARNSIYIVSSLTPAELHTEETKNEGPKLLKAYLEYAWNVSAGKWKPSIMEDHKNRPDWYLSNRVELNYKDLNPNVQIGRVLPFGDLTLYHKNKYYGIIMTDDEYFYNATNAKDIFVYTPEIFIDKKWPFTQLFSRELWRSRTETEDKLRLFLNRISSD